MFMISIRKVSNVCFWYSRLIYENPTLSMLSKALAKVNNVPSLLTNGAIFLFETDGFVPDSFELFPGFTFE